MCTRSAPASRAGSRSRARSRCVWAGPGIRTFTATGGRPVLADEPTLLEIWVCADGYWSDLTKNACPGTLRAELRRAARRAARRLRGGRRPHLRPGASLAELDVLVRDGLAEIGYPGQPSHPICHGIGARAHEPPFAHRAVPTPIEEGMVLGDRAGRLLAGRRRPAPRGQLPGHSDRQPRSSRATPTTSAAHDRARLRDRRRDDRQPAGRPPRDRLRGQRADPPRRARRDAARSRACASAASTS